MEKVKTYVTESWDEIKNKVTWSKYSELQGSAILVLVASTIFAVVIGAIDWVFKNGFIENFNAEGNGRTEMVCSQGRQWPGKKG
jgi:preprotein translocase subunit SecE